MSVRAYENYRVGGEWLPQIPADWGVAPLKTVARIEMGQSPSSDDCNQEGTGVPFLQGCAEFGPNHPTPFQYCEVANKFAEPDDILFSVRAPVGAMNVADQRYGIGRGLCAIRATNIDPRFLAWAIDFSRGQLNAVATGSTYAAVSVQQVALASVPVPPKTEQTSIAAFLDRETGKIDALVGTQRRLIELLKEKRQAVISHAVTKGLDPTAPMKHSGLDLLGEVPAHWEVIQAGRIITEIEQGWSPSAHEREPDDGEPSVLRLSAVKDGRFFPHQRKALPDLTEAELAAARTVSDGDFLLTRANTPDLVGDCAIASSVAKTIFSDLIYRLSFDPRRATPPFLTLAFRSQPMRAQVKRDARGSSMSMAKISHAHIKSWWLALPPVEEQEAILSETAIETQKLDDGMQMAEEAITLLQQRRAALISAAVTGKIDVRGVVSEQAEAA